MSLNCLLESKSATDNITLTIAHEKNGLVGQRSNNQRPEKTLMDDQGRPAL